MHSRSLRTLQRLLLAAAAMSSLYPAASRAAPRNDKKKNPAVRWNQQTPGCTFSRGTHGKVRYGLWSGDIGITLAIDVQELEKVHRRHEQFFAALLEFRYRGHGAIDVSGQNISLKFVSHFQVEQTTLDPDNFSQRIQNDADALNEQTARETKKNPEKKDEKEAFLRAYLKDSAELQEFVAKNSLRPAHLDAANPEVSGWVLFSTKSKWVGEWKKQEEFILRVPLDGKIYEFPFTLPPAPGEVMLRKRN